MRAIKAKRPGMGRKAQLEAERPFADQENCLNADETSMRSPSKTSPKARSTRTDGDRPIQYRLPKPTVEPRIQQPVEVSAPLEVEEDYTPLVRGVLRAASTLFFTQALSSLIIANLLGGSLQVRFFLKFIPYVTILAPRVTFVRVITWATVAAVVVTCFMVMLGLVRHRNEQKLLDGWSSGLLMSGFLLIFQYIRHVLDPPTIDGWVLAQTAGGVVAATVIFLGFRPEPETPVSTGQRDVERGLPPQVAANQQSNPKKQTPVRDPARNKERSSL